MGKRQINKLKKLRLDVAVLMTLEDDEEDCDRKHLEVAYHALSSALLKLEFPDMYEHSLRRRQNQFIKCKEMERVKAWE